MNENKIQVVAVTPEEKEMERKMFEISKSGKTYHKRTLEEIQAETSEQMALIDNEINKCVNNSEKMLEYLAFQSRFYQYSTRNTMLIKLQNMGAQFCQQAKAWNRNGHMILKGQHGMKIFVPTPVTLAVMPDGTTKSFSKLTPAEKKKVDSGELETKKITRFKLGTTFDIAQTDVPAEEYPSMVNRGMSSVPHKTCYNGLKKYSETIGIKVYDGEEEKEINGVNLFGFCTHGKNGEEIHLARNLNDTQLLSVGSHEFGHAVMHGNDCKYRIDEHRLEVEADMFSIMIDQHFGLPVEETRGDHLRNHFNYIAKKALTEASAKSKGKEVDVRKVKNKAFLEIFDTVNKAYRKHIDELDKVIMER